MAGSGFIAGWLWFAFFFLKHLPPLFSLSTGRRLTLRALAFLLGYAALVVLYASATYYALRYAKRQRSGKSYMDLAKVEFGEVRASASGSDVLSLNSPSGQVA